MNYHNITTDDMLNGSGVFAYAYGVQDVIITAISVKIRKHGMLRAELNLM